MKLKALFGVYGYRKFTRRMMSSGVRWIIRVVIWLRLVCFGWRFGGDLGGVGGR
jgi:hypothetical protein